MFTVLTATSAGAWSCVGAKFRIAFTPAFTTRSSDLLRLVARHGQHHDVGMFALDVALELRDVADGNALELPADLVRIVVVGGEDAEAALAESAILGEGRADLTGADDDDAPFAAESEDLAQASGQLGHGVAEPALSEGPEEGEVLSHLGRRRPAALRQLFARYGRQSAGLEVLQKAEVGREASDRGVCNSFHGSKACEFIHKLKDRLWLHQRLRQR